MKKLIVRKKKFDINKFKPKLVDDFIKKNDFTYSEFRELFVSSVIPLDYKNYKGYDVTYNDKIFYVSNSGIGISIDLAIFKMQSIHRVTTFNSVKESLIFNVFSNVNLYKTTDNFNYELLFQCLMSATRDSYIEEAISFVNEIFDEYLKNNKEVIFKNSVSNIFESFEKDNLPIGDVKNKIISEVNNYIANKILA